MRHAILGAGGIGGLLGAALTRAGDDVVLLMRPQSLAGYPGRLGIESVVLGDFEVEVPAVAGLDRQVDTLWVATKAPDLVAALPLAPPERVAGAVVIPFLNGVEHVPLLRERYRIVVAGAIRVESERIGPGLIRQSSPFVRVELAGAAPQAARLWAAGFECGVRDDEISLLWDKLAFLAPIALATTALDAPYGDVRADPRYRGCQDEALAVARAEGAAVDETALRALAEALPAQMRSSMQKDVAAGRRPEIDAIAGPVLRAGRRHGIPVPNTAELARMVEARAAPTP